MITNSPRLNFCTLAMFSIVALRFPFFYVFFFLNEHFTNNINYIRMYTIYHIFCPIQNLSIYIFLIPNVVFARSEFPLVRWAAPNLCAENEDIFRSSKRGSGCESAELQTRRGSPVFVFIATNYTSIIRD